MSAAIQFESVSKWYGEVVALNHVSFEMESGITGLLGPNGAGKSTIMNLCTSQARPSQGEVRVLGERPWSNYALLRRVGLCPERENYYDEMSGYEFVYWLTRCAGLTPSAARRSALDTLERVGMSARMHDPIAGYSRGMRQRVKLAQSIAHRPDVLLLDEPMTGLDPLGRHSMSELIQALAREGKTIVVSSHVLYEIEMLTSSIVLMNKGSVLAHGDVHEVRALIDTHPHSVTVRCLNPRRLAARVLEEGHVVHVSFDDEEGAVTVYTREPNRFYDSLNKLLAREPLGVQSVHSPDDNLQAVFNYLVR